MLGRGKLPWQIRALGDLLGVSGFDGYEWKERRRGPITCQSCAIIIEECRGVRTRAMAGGA